MEPSPFNLPPKIKHIAKQIAKAADSATDAYANERITDEPNITDRWIGAVEQAVNNAPRRRGRNSTAINWQAKTLRASSGRAAEEQRHGADLLGVAEIHVGSQCVSKGFLGQAKRTEPGQRLDTMEWSRLQKQADLMLQRSPASFVLVYSKRHGIRFLPAISVAGFDQRDLFEFNSIPLRQFFEWHLAGYLGDRCLRAPHIATLEKAVPVGSPPGFSEDAEFLSGPDFPAQRVLHLIVRYDAP